MNDNPSRDKIDRGRALLDSKQVDAAATQFNDVARTDPTNAEAWHFLGVCKAQLGAKAEAEDCFRRSITNGSPSAHTYHNLAVLFLESGRLDEAAVNFREAIGRKPDFTDAYLGLGKVYEQQQDFSEAAATCERGIQSNAATPGLFSLLGLVCIRLNQYERAERCYRQAIRRNMANAGTYRNLGIALAMQGKLEDAAQNYERALDLDNRDSESAHNLGLIFSESGQSTRAIAMFERTVEIDTSNISALNDIAREMGNQGRFKEAIEIYRKLQTEHPDIVVAAHNLLCTLNYDPSLGTQTIFNEHVQWGEHLGRRITAQTVHPNPKDPNRQLRIGYVSPDFRTHSVAFFIEPILAHHDKSRTEVFCYTASDTVDATTERLRSAATHWRPIYDLDDTQTADLIRRDQIDILIDLAGHTSGSRLAVFVHKPAPVQVSYLGYPNTTGLTTIDYRFTDEIADPAGKDIFYSEELVRLPGCFCCYQPPECAPAVSPLPATRNGHITFASLVNLVKINEPTVERWAEIMCAMPGSQLVLQATVYADPAVRDVWFGLFARYGIAPERLVLLQKMALLDHLKIYHDVDIALDTFPWSSHTTACHALWMGVPVVTLTGDRHAGRMVTSVLTAIGHPELAATSGSDYVRLAVELTRDPDRLTLLRSSLRQHMAASPLCDAPAFTQRLETAYRNMWLRWCNPVG